MALFEIGHVHAPGDGELPVESDHLAVALAGREAPAAAALWDRLRRAMAFVATEVRNEATAGMHPTRSATLIVGGETVGLLGEIDPAVTAAFDITERVAWLECDLGRLLESHLDEPRYRQPSRFPSSDIDLAFVIDDATPAAAVEAALRGRPATRSSPCTSSTCSATPSGSAPNAAAWPGACDCRPPTAPSPTPRSARSAPPASKPPPHFRSHPAGLSGPWGSREGSPGTGIAY